MSSPARRDGRRVAATPRRQPARRVRTPQPPNSDFVEFLHSLLDIAFTPITYPLRLIRDILTSPLTISVVLKAVLVVVLVVSSAVFSFLAVGAFWWSWGTGGNVEVEGWLVYGSRTHRTPHALLALPLDRFQEDLPYDVQVELELVRPNRDSDDMGNFMVTLELRSHRSPETVIIRASQPSLPPPPLPPSVVYVPSLPTRLIPPCLLPWPFRGLCPSRLLGYSGVPTAKIKERRRKGTLASPARGNEVVLLTKELVEGATVLPGRGDHTVGAAFVSIGREDEDMGSRFYHEVKTTGWVVVRFIPHPTGIRWLLTSNPIPPLILLPPLSLTLTISSALIGFIIISWFGRSSAAKKNASTKHGKGKASPSPKVSPSHSARDSPRRTSFTESDREKYAHHARAWADLEDRHDEGSVRVVSPTRVHAIDTPDHPFSPTASSVSASASGDGDTFSTASVSVSNSVAGETATDSGSATGTGTHETGEGSATETETGDETESWESGIEH
ncbi:uncharacterized protein EHS24_002623 [Apiotrichum porosum]|uniref:Seipin n=1 Tax=Apiotrichum porosum TaxID=105984 RepID=A0A427XHG8_9TREE|nr:uncharacterized protein EHS24_002623 [Apiotrichum porosum]RSH78164.1 hypothetical protein EHS24_002623 [Apiotrichum porosum]